MPLPKDVADAIAGRLREIQGMFKPGAKVLLVVDNGSFEDNVMMGDADSTTVPDLIRELDRMGEESWSGGTPPPALKPTETV